jgi:hypothetical protein
LIEHSKGKKVDTFTMALRMLTKKVTAAAARQYQKMVGAELNTFGRFNGWENN